MAIQRRSDIFWQVSRSISLVKSILLVFYVGISIQRMARGAETGARNTVVASDQSTGLDRIQKRFNDEAVEGILQAQVWTLAHCASDSEKRKAVAAIGMSEQGAEPFSIKSTIEKSGGIVPYRKRVEALLKSDDVFVRGFAAIWLGVLGEMESESVLLDLVRSGGTSKEEDIGEDRGRAAMGLGMLGAKQRAGELADLLRSSNPPVQSGAALGLGYMQATKYAPDIAVLLESESDQVRIAAIAALAEMNATPQAADIAAILRSDSLGDPAVLESALYALAKLKAATHASDIASLLNDRFKKGHAAKAIALLGAENYADAIAKLIEDTEPLNRCDALVALGILRANRFEDEVAKHLDDKIEFVRPYAAWSLVLMESKKHRSRSLEIAGTHRGVLSVKGQGAAQIAVREFRRVFDRAEESFKALSKKEASD